jgi:methylthioribose-1-phosphate isomerase
MTGGMIPTLQTGRAHPHPEPIGGKSFSAVELMPGDRNVVMLDQRKLPVLERNEFMTRPEQVAEAISTLMVRGAPAIGIAAAYGMVLAASQAAGDAEEFLAAMQQADELFRRTRPTAVNLAWALERIRVKILEVAKQPHPQRVMRIGAEARAIHKEEVAACRRMGELGAAFVPDGATILTHCNAGALATGGYGSALGVVRAAREAGKKVRVIASETRPLLQGSRITAWELQKDGIDVEVVTDNMVGQLFARRRVTMVVVGADRIARNADVANKIGTYGLACLAHMHQVPFDVAAPWSTVDLACATGAQIPIEQRSEREVTHVLAGDTEVQVAPDGVRVENPAFDVTPARLIRAIYTERGAVTPVSEGALTALAGARR